MAILPEYLQLATEHHVGHSIFTAEIGDGTAIGLSPAPPTWGGPLTAHPHMGYLTGARRRSDELQHRDQRQKQRVDIGARQLGQIDVNVAPAGRE